MLTIPATYGHSRRFVHNVVGERVVQVALRAVSQ